jgi:SpoVK/Ycf46/Vps4 family AAA+-type ATPase
VVEHTLEQHKIALTALTAVLLNTNRPENSHTDRTIYIGMPHAEKLETANPETNLRSDGFEAFAGIDGVIEELRGMVELAKIEPHILQNAGVERTQAVLFYGPSGVGKTELMKTLTTEIGLNVQDVDFGEISNSHVGEWARNLDSIFDEAFKSEEKIAIILDEFDGLTHSGNQGVNGNINAVLKRRLEQLTLHPNVFVFMATNNIESIDPVVRADKRIPLKIPIGIPSQNQRRDIFKKLLVDNRISSIPEGDADSLIELFKSQEGFDFETLAFISDQFTGGEISQIIKEVNKSRLLASFKNNGVMPSLTMESLVVAINRAKKTRP